MHIIMVCVKMFLFADLKKKKVYYSIIIEDCGSDPQSKGSAFLSKRSWIQLLLLICETESQLRSHKNI